VRHALLIVWLTVLWVVLWRDLSVANVAAGALVGIALSLVVNLGWAGSKRRGHRIHPVGAVKFAGYFAWKVIESNVVLARMIVSPATRTQTGIIAVPLPGLSDYTGTVVANAISLTPGTLTVDVRQDPEWTVFVHVLVLRDIDEARRDIETLARMVEGAVSVGNAGDSVDREGAA
jgi:multicomponent Na+:H+ antiporter subunit E